MAKNLKLKIKNIQLGKAAGLDKLKKKPSAEKAESAEEKKEKLERAKLKEPLTDEEKPRRKAKTRSAFAPKEELESPAEEEVEESAIVEPPTEEVVVEEILEEPKAPPKEEEVVSPLPQQEEPPKPRVKEEFKPKLGPTGRHIKDLLPPKKVEKPKERARVEPTTAPQAKKEGFKPATPPPTDSEEEDKKRSKKVREFKDLKPPRREMRPFDARDRQGLGDGDDERWRKRRAHKERAHIEEQVVRPSEIKVRLPISIKDLAQEMKLKSSEIIQKLFMQGMTHTLNDLLEDETLVQYIGQEFGCVINIDTSEERRLQVSNLSVQEEIKETSAENLSLRPPVVTFMGHVDHGKTSLIDAIRKSKIAAQEAGAITQHIGAFKCKTAVGDLTILDTPGHEAFSSMRSRGALATDIVVLVIAGDEGMRDQTFEALEQAKAAKVTIVVALNKSDKPNFNAENVYRQLSEVELLPEAWGGQTITVNTSAQTGAGIKELLEMLALQAEVLELKANPKARARGVVLESELHKGLGAVARVLIQNGTLTQGDAVIIDHMWGRVKTMRDDRGQTLKSAGPSTPVEITGLSGVPKAGDSFFVVKNEKEAREIAEGRASGVKQKALQQKKVTTLETMMQKEARGVKKILKVVLKADVQGSLEALKTSLLKIQSTKAEVEIIYVGIGEISESDVELASASNAVILGFHSPIESHASSVIKEKGVTVRLHDIIYHAVDDIKALMKALLDKIPEENVTGKAEVKAVFKASQLGNIAGCQVIEGTISRNNKIRLERGGQEVWRGSVASLKRVKEDVKEVKKGLECGILLEGYNQFEVGDILTSYEIIYHEQDL